MSYKAKAMYNLYKAGRITISAVLKAIEDGIITEEESKIIFALEK